MFQANRLSSPFAALALLVAFASAPAQSAPGHTALAQGNQTVSVASLLVSEKAWKHLDKAIEANRIHREDDCEQELAKAFAATPRFPQAYLLRAARHIVARQFQAAIDDVLSARRIDPHATWSTTLLAGAENSLGRFQDALAVLDTLYGPEVNSWQFQFEKTRALVGTQDVAGSLRWSAATLRTAPPTKLDAHLLRADALNLAHRTDETIAELELYLASPLPQEHRTEALSMLERIGQKTQSNTLANIASR